MQVIFRALYNRLNSILFNNELPELPITITTGKYYLAVCKAENGIPKEISVSIDKVHDTEEIIGAILHEMVHVYCIINGIPHYDKGEHLPGFVKAAEEHGLIYDDFMNTNILVLDVGEIFPGK